jgi:Fe-S cluster assembly protein SufD
MYAAALKNFEIKVSQPKKEALKYTSLNSILKMTLPFFKENNIQYSDVKKYFLHEIDSHKVVFIDGSSSFFDNS